MSTSTTAAPDRPDADALDETTDEVTAVRRKDVTYWIDERDGKFPLPWWKLLPLVLLIGGAAIAVLSLLMIPIYQGQIEDAARADLDDARIDARALSFDADYRDLTVSGILPEGVTEEQIRAALADTDGVRDLTLDFRAAAPAPEPEPEPESEPEPTPEPEPVVETTPVEILATIGDDGSIVLSGVVPSAADRDLLIAQAERRFGAGNVVDELTVADLAAEVDGARGRIFAVGSFLNQIPEGVSGRISMTDTDFTSDLVAGSDADAAAIGGVIRSLGQGTDLTGHTVEVVEPEPDEEVEEEIDQLQERFDELEQEIRENVTFATSSDVLNDTATGTLDELVALMEEYQLPVVRISGHTDDQGDEAANQALSEARAAAVRQYLIDAGIDGERIESVGLGETDPIASNDTAEGRATNRRVELVALASFDA